MYVIIMGAMAFIAAAGAYSLWAALAGHRAYTL